MENLLIGLLLLCWIVSFAGVICLIRKRESHLRKALQEKAHFRTIIDSANEGIYVTDSERRFVLWNKAAERLTGYSEEEIIGRRCQDNILAHVDEEGNPLCDSECPLVIAMQKRTMVGPQIVYLRHKDGRRIPVEVYAASVFDNKGEVIGSVEVFQDVTERLKKESALKDKTVKLEALLNSIKEGVLFIDNYGKVNLYNKALKELFGIKDEIIGKEIFNLPKNHIITKVLFKIEESFNGKRCFELYRNRCPVSGDCVKRGGLSCRCWLYRIYSNAPKISNYCKDCDVYKQVKAFLEKPREMLISNRYISVTSSFVESDRNDEIWEVIIFRDVTETKRDAALKLAGAAAHELRQPMQAIIGAVELLLEDLRGQENVEELKEYLNIIEKGCYRMNSIIEDIAKITKFRLKLYADDIILLDIKSSSHERDKGVVSES
jgi:PAS domain S-box-containing protein